MKKYFGWKDPKIWIPILVVVIGSIIGPIIVGKFKEPGIEQNQQPTSQDLNPTTISAPFIVPVYFYPSGWMGDGEHGKRYINLDTAFRGRPRPDDNDGVCNKISYQPGPTGWAGIFWQYPDSNWGDQPGRRIRGAKRIVFWATGERGGEVVEFKAGGIRDSRKRYQDSFEVSIGRVTLTNEWRRYEIPLVGQDLSNVIGAFAWVATGSANPNGLIFYLDDIRYE